MKVLGFEIGGGKGVRPIEVDTGEMPELLAAMFGGKCDCFKCKLAELMDKMAGAVNTKAEALLGEKANALNFRATHFLGGETQKMQRVLQRIAVTETMGKAKYGEGSSFVMPYDVNGETYLATITGQTFDVCAHKMVSSAFGDLDLLKHRLQNFLDGFADVETAHLPTEEEKKDCSFLYTVTELIMYLMNIIEDKLVEEAQTGVKAEKRTKPYFDLDVPERFRFLITKQNLKVDGWEDLVREFYLAVKQTHELLVFVTTEACDIGQELNLLLEEVEKKTGKSSDELAKTPMLRGVLMKDVAGYTEPHLVDIPDIGEKQ